ncbi:MAG: hypothetical protein Q9210_005028 [Variospora velana]
MTDNDPNELRKALELSAPDAPDEHWEAAVECLREWGASNCALENIHAAHGREWILEHLPRQSSSLSTRATAGTAKTSTGPTHCTWLVLVAISIILACTFIIPIFNPLRTDYRKPLTSNCTPPAGESAAFWHVVTKDFSTTSVLIRTLSSQVTANGAMDRSDESRFYSAASNVEKASMIAVDGIHVYTSCLHDFAKGEQKLLDWDGKNATQRARETDSAAWLRNKPWPPRSRPNHSSISATISDQIQTFSHKVSMTTDAGLKLWLLLDRLVMAIRTLRALVHTARMQNSLGGKTNGGAGQIALLNVLDHLQGSAERCRYFLSRIEDPMRNASRLTRQTFEKTVEARLVSAGPSASKDEVILQELHALDAMREDVSTVVRAWGLTVETEDVFLFRGEEAERMWNARQPGVGEWVFKD